MPLRPQSTARMISALTNVRDWSADESDMEWDDIFAMVEQTLADVEEDLREAPATGGEPTPELSDYTPLARSSDPNQSHISAALIRPILGELQRETYAVVERWPDHTGTELSGLAGHADPRRLNRRLTELMRIGVIIESGVRACEHTGRQARTYAVAGE